MFNNIPNEIRLFNQWVVWRYVNTGRKKPTKIPYSAKTDRSASVKNPDTWSSFDQAVHAATSSDFYDGIGFVLTETDPFAFIDLDDTKGDKTSLNRQIKIFNEFESYSERSPSKKGLHIIVRGRLPSGRRNSFVEVYSSSRYMTMTGDVYKKATIKNKNELLIDLWSQLGSGNEAAGVHAGLTEKKDANNVIVQPAIDSDKVIIQRATDAANGEKFADLFAGRWEDYYPSQSEADFALVDIIAFYTQNRAQISRLFRTSKLGQREKANRNDYVNYMLNKCFDRMLPPVDINGLRDQLNAAIEKSEKKKTEKLQALKRALKQKMNLKS